MISRVSNAQIAARRLRQSAVAAARARKRMAKAAAAIKSRAKSEEPHVPPEQFSAVLNTFRREYDTMTEGEQIAFEAVVKQYVLGRVSMNEWRNVTRSIRANYLASLPLEPPIGGRGSRAKDRWVPPPQGW
jgi:hypothetical protein